MKPGRAPESCPKHSRAGSLPSPKKRTRTATVLLWCEPGEHTWRRKRQQGRLPSTCPRHDPPTVSRAWIGDWPTCYLLEDGWSARLLVNRRLLGGASWAVPNALGERLGLEVGDERGMLPLRHASEKMRVRRTTDGFWVDAPPLLYDIGAREGDLLFLTLTSTSYAVSLRPKAELKDADHLGVVLWRCGFAPSDASARERPWDLLPKVLGGSGSTRSATLDRLEARGQYATAKLVEQLPPGSGVSRLNARSPREEERLWQAPLVPDTLRYAVETESTRWIAVGVIGPASRLPPGFLRTDGGLVWCDESELTSRLRELPEGLRLVYGNAMWVRWARAEHAARLVALTSGQPWTVVHDEGWQLGDQRVNGLVEALELVGSGYGGGQPTSPRSAVRQSWPVSALAYSLALDRASKRRIRGVRADPSYGFSAEYPGEFRYGFTLLEVLS